MMKWRPGIRGINDEAFWLRAEQATRQHAHDERTLQSVIKVAVSQTPTSNLDHVYKYCGIHK
jgi:hypothetical protein